MFNINFPPFTWFSTAGDIGFLIFLLGFLELIFNLFFKRTSKKTKGVIVDLAAHSSSRGSRVYRPVFTFKTETGQEVTVEDSLGSNPPRFQVGQEIEVFYRAGNPRRAKINSPASLHLGSTMLMLMGGAFVFMDIFRMITEFREGLFRSFLQFIGLGS